MTVQLTLWELVGLFIAFVTCVGFFLRLTLSLLLKSMDERFDTVDKRFDRMDEDKEDADSSLSRRFESMDREMDRRISAASSERAELRAQSQRQIDELASSLRLLVERLPEQYVRREDWIRFSSTIEAKQDRLVDKFEQVRGELIRDRQLKQQANV